MEHFYFVKTSKLLSLISKGVLSKKDYLLYFVYFIFWWGVYLAGPLFFSERHDYESTRLESLAVAVAVVLGSGCFIYSKNKAYRIDTVLNYVSIYAVEFWKFFLIRFLVAIVLGVVYLRLSIPRDPDLQNSFFWTFDQEVLYVLISEILIQSVMIYRFSYLWEIASLKFLSQKTDTPFD